MFDGNNSSKQSGGVSCFSADDSFQDFMNTYAIVSSNGQVLWMFPAVVKTYCTLDVQHFPFDDQKCDVVFISWTFHGHKLNLTYNESEDQAIYYRPMNQEWFVDKLAVDRHERVRQQLFCLPTVTTGPQFFARCGISSRAMEFAFYRRIFTFLWNSAEFDYKSSAVTEMGDRGHNRHGPKRGGLLCPFRGSWDPV